MRLDRPTLIAAIVTLATALAVAPASAYAGKPHVAAIVPPRSAAANWLESDDATSVPASPWDFEASGTLGGVDSDDIYPVPLAAGQTLDASITAGVGTDFDLYLYAPGTPDIRRSPSLAFGSGPGYPTLLRFDATSAGTYYLDAFALRGVGAYSIQALIRRTASMVMASQQPTAWRGSATLAGTLSDSSHKPVPSARVVITRANSAGAWTSVATVTTGADGWFAARDPAPLTGPTAWRLNFAGDDDRSAALASVSAKPQVHFSGPYLPSRVKVTAAVKVRGTMTPRHPRGFHTVRLQALRLEHGRWVLRRQWRPVNSDAGAASSAFNMTVAFPGRGRWKVQAVHYSDAGHATTYSTSANVTVY